MNGGLILAVVILGTLGCVIIFVSLMGERRSNRMLKKYPTYKAVIRNVEYLKQSEHSGTPGMPGGPTEYWTYIATASFKTRDGVEKSIRLDVGRDYTDETVQELIGKETEILYDPEIAPNPTTAEELVKGSNGIIVGFLFGGFLIVVPLVWLGIDTFIHALKS